MAKKNEIEQSQQESQGFAVVGQGNGDIGIPNGTKGTHRKKTHPVDLHIANQDQSSATNQKKAQRETDQNQ